MRLFISIITFFIILASCSNDEVSNNFEVGAEFLEDDVQIRFTDTFSIKAGTFKSEEIVTSNTSRILIGNIEDNILGKTTAQPYFQLSSSTTNFVVDGVHVVSDGAVFDSIGFVMNLDTYYEGDTTKIQTYQLREILEEVEPKDDEISFFNSDNLLIDELTTLGEVTFTPRPNKTSDSLYIAMNDDFGSRIFNAIQSEEIESSNDFINEFEGLTIVPEQNNSHIVGFSLNTSEITEENTYMRLYYTDDDNEEEQEYIDFFVSLSDTDVPRQFNSINIEDINPLLADIVDSEEVVYSEASENTTFIQAGTGISTRIELPSIKKLKDISNFASILDAQLTFKPDTRSFTTKEELQASLSVFIIDEQNEIIQTLVDSNLNNTLAILSTESDDNIDSNTFYTIDLTSYVNDILTSETDLDYALMIRFTEFDNNVERTIISTDDTDLKLSIKYSTF